MGVSVGATFITVAVRNPHEPDRVWEGEFLVDTGATDTMVPRQHLEAIGLVPEGQRIYGLADGNEIRFDIAGARIEFEGEITWEPSPSERKPLNRCWVLRHSNPQESKWTHTMRR